MFIQNYMGYAIHQDSEDGFFTEYVGQVTFGYCDTLEEIKSDIADYHSNIDVWEKHFSETPLDTPSLDDSFHRHEMDTGE